MSRSSVHDVAGAVPLLVGVSVQLGSHAGAGRVLEQTVDLTDVTPAQRIDLLNELFKNVRVKIGEFK